MSGRPVVTITWKVVFAPTDGPGGHGVQLLNSFMGRAHEAALEAGKALGFVPVDGKGDMKCTWPKPKKKAKP